MKKILEPAREIDVVHETDVLVVGSGPGRLAAALASAGLLGARMLHLPGCHLVKRDRENWFAFVATKAAVHP